jgi:hypothetical protein
VGCRKAAVCILNQNTSRLITFSIIELAHKVNCDLFSHEMLILQLRVMICFSDETVPNCQISHGWEPQPLMKSKGLCIWFFLWVRKQSPLCVHCHVCVLESLARQIMYGHHMTFQIRAIRFSSIKWTNQMLCCLSHNIEHHYMSVSDPKSSGIPF